MTQTLGPQDRSDLRKALDRIAEAKGMLSKCRACGMPVEQAEAIIKEQEDQILAFQKHFFTPANDNQSGFDIPR